MKRNLSNCVPVAMPVLKVAKRQLSNQEQGATLLLILSVVNVHFAMHVQQHVQNLFSYQNIPNLGISQFRLAKIVLLIFRLNVVVAKTVVSLKSSLFVRQWPVYTSQK